MKDNIKMKAATRIEALDGLRFIAFLMVMFYHYLFASPISGFLPKDLLVRALYIKFFDKKVVFLFNKIWLPFNKIFEK